MNENDIVNRVASSALVTLDLEEYHQRGERVLIDIKEQLYEGLILREKEFRLFIKTHDWSSYQDKLVAITCSADAIVPTWAFMLVAIAVKPFARIVEFGTLEKLEEKLFDNALSSINWDQFKGAKVVIKGCSKVVVPVSAYIKAVNELRPIVSSLMYGEACSTVPLFKSKAV